MRRCKEELMTKASCYLAAGVALCPLLCAGSSEAFIGRMEQDFVVIQDFPSELRWFVRDADDEAFLLESAREVFAHPGAAESHRRTFLQACVDRMAG